MPRMPCIIQCRAGRGGTSVFQEDAHTQCADPMQGRQGGHLCIPGGCAQVMPCMIQCRAGRGGTCVFQEDTSTARIQCKAGRGGTFVFQDDVKHTRTARIQCRAGRGGTCVFQEDVHTLCNAHVFPENAGAPPACPALDVSMPNEQNDKDNLFYPNL